MTSAWCKHCHFRIRWYPRWGAWGTATGTREFATQCIRLGRLHEPVDSKAKAA